MIPKSEYLNKCEFYTGGTLLSPSLEVSIVLMNQTNDSIDAEPRNRLDGFVRFDRAPTRSWHWVSWLNNQLDGTHSCASTFLIIRKHSTEWTKKPCGILLDITECLWRSSPSYGTLKSDWIVKIWMEHSSQACFRWGMVWDSLVCSLLSTSFWLLIGWWRVRYLERDREYSGQFELNWTTYSLQMNWTSYCICGNQFRRRYLEWKGPPHKWIPSSQGKQQDLEVRHNEHLPNHTWRWGSGSVGSLFFYG